ncbi:hypothetical protein SERLA73DRAFT_139070 [Serpula lacrymans var. lacrymans S7.3]|uniref:Condensin complex subunit 1 C-terminal domain-containing protein n=1 Tax=Serpula lacrymans var. lacrymans (strain S7.3) TaxID=936435 RepID=F8Q085_SERL3|nr:hypothetical protein SERLA73DRAFT_139070 [Serpula lacrymans var. lacrymans S7.3]
MLDECQGEIIRIDFLSCLQKTFGHAEWTCRESAVEAVGEFAKYEILRRKMLESHFLEDLKNMIHDESLPVRLASVNAIAIFASHDDQCDVITFGFVDYLYQMFNGSNWKSRQISLNAVAECAHHEKLRSKMLESHFLEYLRYLLGDSDCDVQLASAKAIVAFAKHDNSRRAMNEFSMLDLALQRLQM